MLVLTKDYIPYERIVINFDIDSILGETANTFQNFINKKDLGTDNCYRAADTKNTNLFYYLEKICDTIKPENKNLYLTVFLNEICNIPPSRENYETSKDNIINIINYINGHLTEDISLEKICKEFYISKSHLIRKFKNITGVTVWQYIRSK